MKNSDPRVDAYITKSADFAQEVLVHLRKLVHKACPEISETIKWGFPHFEYEGIVCSMAAFKKHCAFTFWKADLIKDQAKVMDKERSEAMGHFGKITSKKDLPKDKILLELIKDAVELNKKGIKLPTKPKAPKRTLKVPDYLLKELKKHKKALTVFEDFSYTHKKEYVEWITEAKTDATREKRMKTMIEWLKEGKSRNWKYM